jgi:hypothetical protein
LHWVSHEKGEMMDEDTLDEILNAKDFATIKNVALNAPDFEGRLRGIQATKIDRITLGSLVETTNTFAAETSQTIEETFKEGFRISQEYEGVRKTIEKMSNRDPLFAPLWSSKQAMFATCMVGYTKAVQVSALLMQVNVRLTEALVRSYGGHGLSVEEKDALNQAALKARQIAELLDGLDKLNRA